ncbi:alpha-amylase [Marinagarivorans algicola]|uniref:alpha-amylase n=1 Tax=Marinagarivorans algicola TaxID=1513270 RepID=UPI0006B62973|nr:alpha-amylase family protein [Marinagarivorans algicola]
MNHTIPKKITTWMLAALASGAGVTHAQIPEPPARTAFVHLFEWSWNDIAEECETVLGPKGFAAVQVSPPQGAPEGDEWWRRYQPTDYELNSRSGNEAEFKSMVSRCADVGVGIYVDAVINHMQNKGFSHPEVPYGYNDFHHCLDPIDYQDRWKIQNCDLLGLSDLKTESAYVQQKIADYMNKMVDMGVAGFRIDGAKHIPAADIGAILRRVRGNPYIFQEVIRANEPVQPEEYSANGDITEFTFERAIGSHFKGQVPIKNLRYLSQWDNVLPSDQSVVFVSNHDDQREHPERTLTYKDTSGLYYIGEIFMLAYPYGYPKVMSSYFFDSYNQGRPDNGVHSGDGCGQGWVCEHRWRGIANMVNFRNYTVSDWSVNNWWDNGNNQIAFSRGDKGFVAINREDRSNLNRTLQTGMPSGEYCDIINGNFDAQTKTCEGETITVNSDGTARFNVSSLNASAIHVGAKVGDCTTNCNGWKNAYLRGTPNNWQTTPMTRDNGLWTTTVSFSGDNPRFKISRFDDWSEAYPAEDFLITQGAGTYRLTFDDNQKNISAVKLN